jgi:drug/metabolite transporter (DMT)-like permease
MTGALLAVVSGALASGLGYVAWYAALRAISTTRAALVQLPVPVLSAVGGLLLLGEPLSFRLVLSSVVVLGGVGMALAATERVAPGPSTTGRP